MQVYNSLRIIAKIETREMCVWAKFAKISSRDNFYLYSILKILTKNVLWTLTSSDCVTNGKKSPFLKWPLLGAEGSNFRQISLTNYVTLTTLILMCLYTMTTLTHVLKWCTNLSVNNTNVYTPPSVGSWVNHQSDFNYWEIMMHQLDCI